MYLAPMIGAVISGVRLCCVCGGRFGNRSAKHKGNSLILLGKTTGTRIAETGKFGNSSVSREFDRRQRRKGLKINKLGGGASRTLPSS